ncbi:AAA family ATPase [Sulfitobacter sp. HNIBRBA2951]|uniref:ATP-binding protein n=1 Tax=Sulfitobacter aquimarinus TaxID=3158557 RepID=UPI0032DE5F55
MDDLHSINHRPALHAGERRQVSVLFADMVGYTATVEALGEDKSLALTRMIYQRLTDAIVAQGGAVRSFAGDSVMAVFGIPETLEDSALRSCRAALAVAERFAADGDLFEAEFGLRPQMRVGVSSGLAVMAPVQGAGSELTAVGNTVNLAARIQALAPAGGCLMCDATRRLVRWRTETEFDADHKIKGMADTQKLWHLRSVLEGATRFDASVAQGLKEYVGREDALAVMDAALARASTNSTAIDLVAEPGLGKTRLVHEFLRRIGHDGVTVLTGQCAADSRNTPLFPFLEVLRTAYRVRRHDTGAQAAQKLREGLDRAHVYSDQNHGLLLNLLGLPVPDGALDGMDGVLIGLRTRDLLATLLKERCRLGLVVLRIEDLHWIDGASEDVLEKLIRAPDRANLLVVYTRRPERAPTWLDSPNVTQLPLTPLEADDILLLAQSHLGVEDLPADLVAQLTERAGGNPLFGEEIISYLTQRGELSVQDGTVLFHSETAEGALPASMQNLLAARFDRLPAQDRDTLHAAAVMGRRFDPSVLALVLGSAADAEAALTRLQAQDIITPEAHTSEYIFRHVLLRDAVYQSLLSEQSRALHLAVGQAIETRAGPQHAAQEADTLAYHYARSGRDDLAFKYTALAGARSLGIFSLVEADAYFTSGLAMYERDPTCASDAAFVAFLADYALCCNLSMNVDKVIALADKMRPYLDRIGDSRAHVHFLHHLVSCVVSSGQINTAAAIQLDLTAMAARLDDPEATAYALVSELATSCYSGTLDSDAFDAKSAQAEALLAQMDDAFLKNFYLANLGWNAVSRGRVVQAHTAAQEMVKVGRATNDPRALGYGTAMTALTALATDDHETALGISDHALSVSRAEFERTIAKISKYGALVPLGKPGAAEELQGFTAMCNARGLGLYRVTADVMAGIANVMDGRIGAGLAQVEEVIAQCDAMGLRNAADWYRLYLAEVYLEILSGNGEASLGVMLRNFRALAGVMLRGPERIIALADKVRQNKLWDKGCHHIGRTEMIVGMMYKVRKKHALARTHLTIAQSIVSAAGPSPMLTKIEEALAELPASS